MPAVKPDYPVSDSDIPDDFLFNMEFFDLSKSNNEFIFWFQSAPDGPCFSVIPKYPWSISFYPQIGRALRHGWTPFRPLICSMLDREHGVTSSALYKDFLMERQSILDNCSPPYDEAWLFLMTLRVGTPGENLGREPEWFSRDPFAMLGDERPGKFVTIIPQDVVEGPC